jgi:hypothetical protein
VDAPTTVGLRISVGPDGEPEEIFAAAERLRRELLELEVDSVETPGAGEAPPGTRGLELAALGALVVTVSRSEVLKSVLAAVRSWLAGSRQRSIKIELDGDVLELTGVSSSEQRRLTDEWLRRLDDRQR